jgi:hypothetical protein
MFLSIFLFINIIIKKNKNSLFKSHLIMKNSIFSDFHMSNKIYLLLKNLNLFRLDEL